jgi:hypothetical protein
MERAPRRIAGQIAAWRICLRQFLFHAGTGRLCGARLRRERRYILRRAPPAVSSAIRHGRASLPPIRRCRVDNLHSSQAFTVIGIAPPGFFRGPRHDSPPDFWMPLQTEPYLSTTGSSILHHAGVANWLYPLGRVRPGTNIGALQTKLSVALRQWLSTRPELHRKRRIGHHSQAMHVVLAPAAAASRPAAADGQGPEDVDDPLFGRAAHRLRQYRQPAAGARHYARAEVAVRMALGAGRRRVIRQILTESILLSCIGGLAGLAVAYAGSRTDSRSGISRCKRNMPIEASPSLPVLGFAFLVSLVTGVLFGVAPAWFLRMRNRPRRCAASTAHARPLFAAAEGAGRLSGGFVRGAAGRRHPDDQIAANLRTSELRHRHGQPLRAALRSVAGAGYTIDRCPRSIARSKIASPRCPAWPTWAWRSTARWKATTGASASSSRAIPLRARTIPAARPGTASVLISSIPSACPWCAAADFTEQDTATSPQVAVVNQTFVKKFFPNQDPIGQHFGIDLRSTRAAWEIVGVFADFKMNNPRDPVRPVYLRPLPQKFIYKVPGLIAGETRSMFINAMILNFNRPQTNVDALIRHTLAGIDPNLTVMDLRSSMRRWPATSTRSA